MKFIILRLLFLIKFCFIWTSHLTTFNASQNGSMLSQMIIFLLQDDIQMLLKISKFFLKTKNLSKFALFVTMSLDIRYSTNADTLHVFHVYGNIRK